MINEQWKIINESKKGGVMNMKICVMVVAISILGLAGYAAADYIEDVAKTVKAADWSKMETVSITLTEYAYSPSTLVFQKDAPYKLEIINKGTTKHYFTAQNFFTAIATRKVQSNTDGEIKAPYFLALEVYPGRQLDLYFIPVKTGTYDLLCTIEGHSEKGMVGKIEIK